MHFQGNLLFSNLTSLAVISSLTLGAANIPKAVMPSTTRGTDSETDVHCRDVVFPLICDMLLIAELPHGIRC